MFFLTISRKTSRRLKKESGIENETIALRLKEYDKFDSD